MDITAVSVICITAAIMCKLVEKDGREFSIVISLAAGVYVILYIISGITEITEMIDELFLKAGIPDQYPEIIYKCLGVCYITQLGSGCCRDCGESGLASVVEAAGRIAILAVSLPLFKALVNIIEKILT